MGAKRKRIREFSEKECAKFIFGEEIGSLVDDERVHDGWRGELRMFSSVFHQNDDLLDNAKGSDTKLWPSVTIASDGCVPFQPGNAATSVIEYSCLPEGLEYQSSKARQLNPSFEFSASKGIGTSVGNDCGVLSSEAQKNLGIDLNIPSIADASLEKYFTALNPRPAEILGDGSLHLVSPEVVDGANEHSDKKETTQLRRKSIVESSRDIPKEVGMMLVLDTALIDTSSQKKFGTFSTRVQTIDREPLTLDMPCESSISSEKDKSGTSRHLNEECAVSTSAGSNPTPTAGVSCSLVEMEPHGTESKQVNLQNDTPGSIVISVAHENNCGVLRSKENVVNNSLHGSGPMDTPSDHSSVACITRHEENYAHHSMPEMLLDAAENALKSVNAGITTHHITDLVIESLVPDNDICSQDCSTEKPRSWYDRRCKRQPSQKTAVTFDVSVLDTPTPDKGLAQETTNGKVVITPPVSQESSVSKASESNVLALMDVDIQPVSQEISVSKASESNVLAIMDVDIQPLNIFEGKNETRTQEALLLMSDEVKTSWKKSFTAKLRTRLWQIIKDFLVAAGFEVQYWNRVRGTPDSIYVSPGKDQVRYASAVKAWKASADILFRGKKKTMLDAPTREWKDTTHFWVELTDVLALVGNKRRKMVHKTAMLKKWVLLDPFVTMLFIERLKPLKDRENANTSIRSAKGSTRLVRQRKLKSPVESGDPFVFRLDSELQLESDTTHNQLTDVLQAERNGDLGGTHVYAKIRSTALAKGSSGSRKHGFPSQTNRAVPEVMIGDDRRKSPVRGPLDGRCSVFEANVQAVKVYKCKVSKEIGRKKVKGITVPAKKVCHINDDDLLIASIIKNKDLGSNSPPILKSMKAKKKISRSARKLKSYRGGCKLLPRSPGKGGRHLLSGKQPVFYKRTVLSWMIDSGALFENEIVWYQSKSGTMVKNGWITRDGLLCKCCNKIFSLSEFKIHASSKVGRSSLNLFVGTGDSFTLCQLQAWSAEYKTRKAGNRVVDDPEIDLNDDTCGLCGDGGVLICCDNCPSTFHHTCLGNQLLPDNNWYCPYCTCEICGKAVVQPDTLSSSILMQCLQCERKYHKPCLSDRIQHGGDDPTKETWFCGENCQEIHSGLRSHLGVMHHVGEGFSWTLLKCIQSDQRVHSAQGIALMAECNTKLAVALSIMEECFVQMIDLRTGIDMIPHALYNWGSCFTRLNYQGFYTVVLEKGDEIISVASIRVHGVMVAELPLIATCSEYRRQGMCRRLMNAIEEVLMSVKVERMVILAIPELIDTWTSGFGFKQMDDSDKELFNNINLMIFPGTTLLEKRLHMPKNFQEKEIKHVTKKVCGRFEPDDPHSVVPVPEPGEQLAESCKDGVNVGLEPVQRNLRLEEISLNGSVLESALEVDPSSTTIESKHHNSQIGYTVNGYMAESVQVDQEKLDARLACISTGNPRHDAQIGVCTNMNESKDNSKENNAAGRDIPMVSVEGRNEVKLNHGDLGLTVSEHDSEGCKGNLEVSTELMKCSAPTCSTVCGHMIQSNCRSDYTQLVSRNTFQKMNNMITLTSAATDLVVDPENELFTAIVGCPDSSLCSQHAPPFFISDISDGKITKDRLAAVDLLDLNSSVLCKDMRSSPTKDHVTHQSLLFEKDLVNSPFSNSTRLSHIKVNSTEDGDDVEKHRGKGLNAGAACVEKHLLDIATENDSRLLCIAVGSGSTENGVDAETVDRADNRVGKMTCMMSGSEESGELENISLCESSVLIPQIDINSSLNAPSFTSAATKEIVNAPSFTSAATEEIVKVMDSISSMSKSPNLEEKSSVLITLPKSPAENIAAQTGILYPSTFEVTGFQGSTAGHSSVVTQSTTVGALQEPSRYVQVNGSPPGMNNPLTTSVNDKNAPSNEAGLDNSTGAQICKFTKGKYLTQKEIVLGLACQTYGVMHPKRSHVKGSGRNQRFRGK